MKKGISKKELINLLVRLKDQPKDLDLINQIAIGYFENPLMITDDEDLKHFELAYSLKKTVKAAHNLAWYLFYEFDEHTRALEIQKECMLLKPKSYYPYYLYGCMLQDVKRYYDAIPFLEKAYSMAKKSTIYNNIGYCYFQVGEYEKAKDYFRQEESVPDFENISLYNLALTEWKMGNKDQVWQIAKRLSVHCETSVDDRISGYELGILYFLIDDFAGASDCVVRQGVKGIDMLDWPELSYSLFRSDYGLWKDQLVESIAEREQWCIEIENQHEDWSGYSKEDRKERMAEFKEDIKNRQETLRNGLTKPVSDLSKFIIPEYCGCLLFDCKRHKNQPDDE